MKCLKCGHNGYAVRHGDDGKIYLICNTGSLAPVRGCEAMYTLEDNKITNAHWFDYDTKEDVKFKELNVEDIDYE